MKEKTNGEQGYKKLQIYQLAHQLAIQVHSLTLELPSFEKYEEGSQIRRSSKSVASNIVEGYALRKYKQEFVHYLFRAYGSCEETIQHLEFLFDTKSLNNETLFQKLHLAYNHLCGKILRYIQAIDETYEVPNFMKEPEISFEIHKRSNGTLKSSQTSNRKSQTSHRKR